MNQASVLTSLVGKHIVHIFKLAILNLLNVLLLRPMQSSTPVAHCRNSIFFCLYDFIVVFVSNGQEFKLSPVQRCLSARHFKLSLQ